MCSHLDVQVVVVSLSQLDEHGKQREDGPGAEESALRPDHGHAEQSQGHRQQPVKPVLQETLPVPLCRTTHTVKVKRDSLPPRTFNAATTARVEKYYMCIKVLMLELFVLRPTYSRCVDVSAEPAGRLRRREAVDKLVG